MLRLRLVDSCEIAVPRLSDSGDFVVCDVHAEGWIVSSMRTSRIRLGLIVLRHHHSHLYYGVFLTFRSNFLVA